MMMGAFCAQGFAGQETYSGKEMQRVAPAPPECPSWAGFYIGGFGGYKHGIFNTDLELNGLWDTQFPDGRDVVESQGSRDIEADGAEVGGLIGYNYQWNNWVFGAEAAGGYLWLRDSHATGLFDIPTSGDVYNISTSVKTHYLATFGGRLGYALCRWMPYVTGGLALGDIDLKQEIRNVAFPFREGGSTSDTSIGWYVGSGLEYAITNHWRARVQYQYVDLGEADFHSAGVSPIPGFADFTGNHEAHLTEHNVSVAIIYGF